MVAFATQVKRRRGTEAQNNEFTGAEGEIVVDLTNMTLRVHDGTTKGGFVVGGAGRNIGDIFFTTRTESSVNGAFEADGSTYNTADFAGGGSIGDLLRTGKLPYVSLADYANIVNANGSCRCFGWDGGAEFRVPKLNNVFVEAGLATFAGEFIPAGVPNIEGGLNVGGNYGFSAFTTATGAFKSGTHTAWRATTQSQDIAGASENVEFAANASNAIYGASDTVQPPAVKYRAMVQLAVGATDDAVITAGGVLNDISALKNSLEQIAPVGTIVAFAGTTAPAGWLICDGGEISRDNYAQLFSVIGETYGAGDGATSFNLPNLDGHAPWYDSTAVLGTMSDGGLPNITGQAPGSKTIHISYTGALYSLGSGGGAYPSGTSYGGQYLGLDASRSSSIYGASTTVKPASVAMIFCIKY